MFAHVVEGEVELVADFVAHHPADADAARLGQTLEAGGEVDPVTEDVAVVNNDVALVDAETELYALISRNTALRPAIPCCTSTAQRTARGQADAKAKGIKFGRKPILTLAIQQEARKRLDAGETQGSVVRSYNVSQSTISRLTA